LLSPTLSARIETREWHNYRHSFRVRASTIHASRPLGNEGCVTPFFTRTKRNARRV